MRRRNSGVTAGWLSVQAGEKPRRKSGRAERRLFRDFAGMTVHLKHGARNHGSRLAVAGLCLCLTAAAGLAAPVAKKPADGAKTPPAVTVTTPAERCDDLEKQFDESLPKHTDAKNLTSAKKWRTEGEKRCDAGKHAVGAWWLARALTELGVAPEAEK
jgi:hypothetical protein